MQYRNNYYYNYNYNYNYQLPITNYFIMKKILLSAAALLTLLFAASCQKEDFSGADGEFATVTLTVQAPASPSTKALGDGTKAKNLVFGVFDENGAELTDLRQGDWMNANQTEITFNDQLQAKVTVNLAKGKTYTFICWAQTKEYGDATNPTAVTCYDFKNLDDIKVDYTVNNEANNEHRDAFYACVTSGIIKKDYSTTITLTRPFGQLNIGTEDMAAAQSAGLDLANLWVELSVTNCPTHLVADMTKHVYTVDGSVTAKFTKALCPASVNPSETLNVDQDGDKAFAENEKYGWLSMNYIFTAHKEVKDDATKNITFDLYEGDLSLAKYSRDNVPFIANYRTNLLGRLLTTDGDITVIIDPVPDGDENITGGIEDVSIITIDELNAVTAAGTYNVGGTLTKDGVKSAAMGAGYEDVEIKDADNKTATYTLKVPTSKADGEYEAYYKAGGYLIVAVDAAVAEDGKVTLKPQDTHVAYVPEGIEDEEEEEEEPALKATLAVDPATIALDKADAATVKFTVTAENCTWTATCDNENVKVEIAENVVNVTVPANEDTEKEATYVVTVTPAVEEGVETCEPVTVTITQAKKEAAVEPEEPVVPSFPEGEYWIVSSENYATPLTGNYGYLKVTAGGYLDNVFTIMSVEGGYTIQDPDGYFYYQTGSYDSYNRAKEYPTEGAVWTIEANEDGTYTITNAATQKTIQYDNGYNSYGCYAEVKGVAPQLIPADGATVRPIFTVTPVSKSIASDVTEVAINIESNQGWTIAPGEGVVLDVTSGENNATVTMTIPVNESEEAKEYTATVSSEGFEPVVVKVTQAGVPTGDQPQTVSLTWTLDTATKAYSEKGTIDGMYVDVLKLGASSAPGKATVTLPAGTYKISYSAVAWNKKSATLLFKVGDETVNSQPLTANTGASNQSPYTITTTDTDHYEFNYSVSSETVLTLDTTNSTSGNQRAIIWNIVAYVK